MKKIAETVFFILIGYTIALMIRYAMPAQRKKVALAGVIGAFVGKGKWQAIFAGVAGYDIAEEAGLSPYQEKPLAGLTKTKGNAITIEIASEDFTYVQSGWLPLFSFNPDAPKNGWRSIINRNIFSKNQSEETGVYCLRKADTKQVYYVGIAYSNGHGFERVLRHFQEGIDKSLKHDVYKNRKNWEVKFYQIDNPTRERLEMFEWWVHDKLKPTDSKPQSSAIKIIFSSPEEREADKFWEQYQENYELKPQYRKNKVFENMLEARGELLSSWYAQNGRMTEEMETNPYFVPF